MARMITNPMEMRALTFELSNAAWTYAALGALFESGLVDHLREPRTAAELAAQCKAHDAGRIARLLDVAVTTGAVIAEGDRWRLADGVVPMLQQPMRASFAGDVRTHLMQAVALLDSSRDAEPRKGWRHTDRALLQAQGDASSAFPPMFKANIVPQLGDLGARLDAPGARFLDVGVGVASLAIAMCRAWPRLSVVGLDVADAPLAIARENVAAAQLADRIELRKIPVESLTDDVGFDLAWLPGIFIPEVAAAARRVAGSLRPGGWILFPLMAAHDAPRPRAVGALLNELWGGPVLSPAEAEALLKEAGLSDVRSIQGPPWAPALFVGRRG
jgi:2-polyprenyl-3-methyl-5-hydroxy-6-metoxy-1,4-benzoquinol methylase